MRMKKFIFYFCLCWGVITIVGCNKDDDFDSSDNYTDVTAIDESLLEILLIARNVLIINTNWDDKITKETNWKQHNRETPK